MEFNGHFMTTIYILIKFKTVSIHTDKTYESMRPLQNRHKLSVSTQ